MPESPSINCCLHKDCQNQHDAPLRCGYKSLNCLSLGLFFKCANAPDLSSSHHQAKVEKAIKTDSEIRNRFFQEAIGRACLYPLTVSIGLPSWLDDLRWDVLLQTDAASPQSCVQHMLSQSFTQRKFQKRLQKVSVTYCRYEELKCY